MTACPLTVIPLKCTGVPITQLKKIILMYNSFFLIFKQIKKKIGMNKPVFNFNFNI
jgi:hypothetical protein